MGFLKTSLDDYDYGCLRASHLSRLRTRWLKTAGIVLNIMVIKGASSTLIVEKDNGAEACTAVRLLPNMLYRRCVFWWCIVVGVVLSLILNYIISAPTQSYASLSVLIFMTGAFGLIVSLPAFKCVSTQGKCGLICYVTVLCITAITLLSGAIHLILVSNEPVKLYDWVDSGLKEVFLSGNESTKGMEAVFLIENQFSCCGFNGQLFYPPNSMSVGCCDDLRQKCTADTARSKSCREAVVEVVQKRFKNFGISLVFAVLVLLTTIVNSSLMLARLRRDENESESK
ncbi:hypothetical protein Aperf_G00000044120 [Anoplocephala perfoliata]